MATNDQLQGATDHGSSQRTQQFNGPVSVIKIIVSIIILGVAVFVALSPTLVYAPTPRIVLYALVALLPAILFGAEVASRLEVELPGMILTTTGAAAICLGTLMLLTHLSKPEQQIAVYHVLDENQNGIVGLNRPGVLEIPITSSGLQVTKFIDDNTLIVIFPEQVGECQIHVQPVIGGKVYRGNISYSGNRESELILGKHLK